MVKGHLNADLDKIKQVFSKHVMPQGHLARKERAPHAPCGRGAVEVTMIGRRVGSWNSFTLVVKAGVLAICLSIALNRSKALIGNCAYMTVHLADVLSRYVML